MQSEVRLTSEQRVCDSHFNSPVYMHHMYWETAKTTAVHLILNGISKLVMFIGDIFENSKKYCTGYRIKRSRGCSDFSFRVNRAPPVA